MSKTAEQLAAQTENCTAACWAQPRCLVCDQRKSPIGRDPGLGAYMCGYDCPGYSDDPPPGHYWPGEEPFE